MTAPDPPPLVLVVEDYDDARVMYCAWLTMDGCRVAEAADGREAVERARGLAPDVIVMDLSLPVMDGRAALAALRADPRTRELPVVVLSGESAARALDPAGEGWAAFVAKPCTADGLVSAVRRVLEARGRRGFTGS